MIPEYPGGLFPQANATWIDSIHMNAEEDSVEVKLNVPCGENGEKALHTYTIPIGRDTPDYMRDATKVLSDAVIRHVREHKGKLMCQDCTGACCTGYTISVTSADIERMGSELSGRAVVRYKNGETGWTGNTGVMARVPYKGAGKAQWEDDMACVLLDQATGLCTEYDRRPQVCRDYSGYDCARHEAGSEKLVQLRRNALTVAVP